MVKESMKRIIRPCKMASKKVTVRPPLKQLILTLKKKEKAQIGRINLHKKKRKAISRS
jgi:hypothetical protein